MTLDAHFFSDCAGCSLLRVSATGHTIRVTTDPWRELRDQFEAALLADGRSLRAIADEMRVRYTSIVGFYVKKKQSRQPLLDRVRGWADQHAGQHDDLTALDRPEPNTPPRDSEPEPAPAEQGGLVTPHAIAHLIEFGLNATLLTELHEQFKSTGLQRWLEEEAEKRRRLQGSQ